MAIPRPESFLCSVHANGLDRHKRLVRPHQSLQPAEPQRTILYPGCHMVYVAGLPVQARGDRPRTGCVLGIDVNRDYRRRWATQIPDPVAVEYSFSADIRKKKKGG